MTHMELMVCFLNGQLNGYMEDNKEYLFDVPSPGGSVFSVECRINPCWAY